MNEAIALLALGRMDEALAGFDAALAREPGHVHALFNRGLARKRAGLPGAEADFARVHEIDPDDPDALYQLAPRAWTAATTPAPATPSSGC